MWDIEPEPSAEYQIRVSVYGTTGIPQQDVIGGSDVYITGWIDDSDKQSTDTHWRLMDQKCASFNYRMIFNVKTPRTDPISLKLQAWDQDFLRSEFITEWKLDLTEIVKLCQASQKKMQICHKFKKNLERGKKPGSCVP